MNKLASIDLVASLGFRTTWPRVILARDERGVRRAVDSFYYDRKGGWVLRCGELPDRYGRKEAALPWDLVYLREDLVKRAGEMQREIGDKYCIFCHERSDMIRGGTMVVYDGRNIVVEAADGGPRELSAMFRGKRDPQQHLSFGIGMSRLTDAGKQILTLEDLRELRKVERTIPWAKIGGVYCPVAVEFSRLSDGTFYVHDVGVAA